MHARGNARRIAGPLGLAVAIVLSVVVDATWARAGEDPAGLLGTPASVAITPAEATLSGRRATRQLIVTATDADGSMRDLTRVLEWVSLDPAIADRLAQGAGRAPGQRHGDDRGAAGERRGQDDGQGRGDGAARAGELPPRRDPRLQPGRVQHGGLPRHADRQGGVPAQPPRLPARPGLRDLEPRGRRPADQPARRRDQPDPPQAARASPPRGGPAAGPRLQDATSSSATGSPRGRKDDPDAPAAVRLEILPGVPRPERPGAGRSRSSSWST